MADTQPRTRILGVDRSAFEMAYRLYEEQPPMRFSRKGILQWFAFSLPAVALTLFFIGWSGIRANGRATREQFEKLHAGMTLDEVQEIMAGGCEVWSGGFESEVQFQDFTKD